LSSFPCSTFIVNSFHADLARKRLFVAQMKALQEHEREAIYRARFAERSSV
jgi:hypothetical protein